MSGGDPTLAIQELVPHITPEQVTGARSAIYHQPREHWLLFSRMLGLTGEATNSSRKIHDSKRTHPKRANQP